MNTESRGLKSWTDFRRLSMGHDVVYESWVTHVKTSFETEKSSPLCDNYSSLKFRHLVNIGLSGAVDRQEAKYIPGYPAAEFLVLSITESPALQYETTNVHTSCPY